MSLAKFSEIAHIFHTMIAIRYIIPDKFYAHVFFKCHNRQFLLNPHEGKSFLIFLRARHMKKYGIRIYEAITMSNHAHLLIESPNAEEMGNFIIVGNSNFQIAIQIGVRFEKETM